jgi:hypothetical protein
MLVAIALVVGAAADPVDQKPPDQAQAANAAPKPPQQAPGDSQTGRDAASPSDGAISRRPYTTETVRGRVMWTEDALARGFGVATEPDAAKKTVVLKTADDKLWPLVPDTRGQAFVVDGRLRDINLQLLVRHYQDAPMLQVIRVYQLKDGVLYELDYWCDICSIPMFILKDCECCQGPTRLRQRAVESGSAGGR